MLLKRILFNISVLKHFDLKNDIILKINSFNEIMIKMFNQKFIDDFYHFICYYNKIMIFAKMYYLIYNKKILIIILTFK